MRRLALLLSIFVFGLALASCGGSEGPTTTATATETTTAQATTTTQTTTAAPASRPRVVRVTVENGAPKGGIVRAAVEKGDRVVLVVRSDVADEIHLHGYDRSTDVAAGGTARLRFRATVAGRFEVELESRGVQIADLTVEP